MDIEGTLMLHTDSSTKLIDLAVSIPIQTMYLRKYRVQMKDDATAIANPIIYLDIPRVYNVSKMVDSNIGHIYLPILLNDLETTLCHHTEIPISMNHTLHDKFVIRVLGQNFEPLPAGDLIHAAFQFSFKS